MPHRGVPAGIKVCLTAGMNGLNAESLTLRLESTKTKLTCALTGTFGQSHVIHTDIILCPPAVRHVEGHAPLSRGAVNHGPMPRPVLPIVRDTPRLPRLRPETSCFYYWGRRL